MLKIKYTALFFILFLLFPFCLFSQPGRKGSGNGNRLYFGPVLGFYSINKNHATSPSQKPSAVIGFKREQRIGNDYKTFFLIGAEYFFHGLNFRSYYFDQDTLQLYDKSFGYNYSLFIHELNLPIQFKYLFKRADNSLFSPYVIAGYQLRYLLPGILKVKQNGVLVKDDNPEVVFKNALLTNKMNSFVSLGIGWQKNSLRNSKGSFFVELNGRYGFSSYYFSTNYSASSLYISGTHLVLNLGLKF
jgi:hypothetical protein